MFDLARLTEFNHALVYGFDPESSQQCLLGSQKIIDTFIPSVSQYQDVFDAYLYAQETILSQIKEQGVKKVSPEMLLEWVKKIHGFMGKTLLQSYGIASGEYTSQVVLRWHQGAELNAHFILYLSKSHPSKSPKAFAAFLQKNFQIEHASALAFILLLEKILEDKTIHIHESQLPFINVKVPDKEGIIGLNKLASAYNLDQLSPSEKECVNKIVKICILPFQIPHAMAKWASETIMEYHSCNPGDLNQVSDFLTNTFYNLTEIHPFTNANGRTATCLLNVFLCSLGYPSILLRYPGEIFEKNSLYQKAFAKIDSSLLPLKALINDRISQAQKSAFSNNKLKKAIELRIALMDLYKTIISKHPQIGIDRLHFEMTKSITAPKMDELDASIYLLTIMIDKAGKKLASLDQEKLNKTKFFFSLNNEQIPILLERLESMSGYPGWKYSPKIGMAWLEHPNNVEAQAIADKLKTYNAAEVTLTRRVDNKVPVIKCENIDYQKFVKLLAAGNTKDKDTVVAATPSTKK